MDKAPPLTDGIANMRPGIRSILETALAAATAEMRLLVGESMHPSYSSENIGRYAAAIEAALFESTSGALNRKYDYSIAVKHMTALLRQPLGIHPEDVGGLQILRGTLSISEAIRNPPNLESLEPRNVIRRMFAATLVKASEVYANDKERVIADARAIESSCYNHVVRVSKLQEDPPRRQWDSTAFSDMYSTKCGKINILLDPTSTVCEKYGTTVIARILSGELLPGGLGDASPLTLCPAATEAERAEINARTAQKVPEKHSNLFECPKCHVRECVYKEIHTRGSDEAPDYYCRCKCGFRFKGRS